MALVLRNLSIKELYVPALAEGEGVGTAYEYYAKRLVLRPWLARRPRPQTLLVAGLPQKYGASLDFVQVAAELSARVLIIDERPQALAQWQTAVAAVQAQGWWPALQWSMQLVADLSQMAEVAQPVDLALSSEVLQRLAVNERLRYRQRLQEIASRVALFTPNGDNPAHTEISGLAGLRLDELQSLVGHGSGSTGYIDMPPFPPGITRSETQREQASTGLVEALAMWGLAYYARLERFLPTGVRRRQSHIVYALLPSA